MGFRKSLDHEGEIFTCRISNLSENSPRQLIFPFYWAMIENTATYEPEVDPYQTMVLSAPQCRTCRL